MSKDNKRSTWIFGETVGNWFTRRLSEEFSSLSDSQKISAKGNPLDPKKWLSKEAILDLSNLYSLEKAETLHIATESLRQRLSQYLGYYGYPMYESGENSKDAEKHNTSIKEKVAADFRSLIQGLPSVMSRCPFCSNDSNYFLGIESKIGKPFAQKICKKFYIGSHNFKQFGAAHKARVIGSFEVEIIICEECLAKHEKLFIMPTSKTLKDISSKFNNLKLSYKNIAQILDVDPSTITRIVNEKTSFIEENLLRKIIGIWQIGDLRPYKLTTRELYKEYISDMVKVALGEIDLESFLNDDTFAEMRHYRDAFPDVEEGFYLESSKYQTKSFNFDKDGIYVEVEVTDYYRKNIRDMIYSLISEQTLLFTLATPESELGDVKVLKSCISPSERVC